MQFVCSRGARVFPNSVIEAAARRVWRSGSAAKRRRIEKGGSDRSVDSEDWESASGRIISLPREPSIRTRGGRCTTPYRGDRVPGSHAQYLPSAAGETPEPADFAAPLTGKGFSTQTDGLAYNEAPSLMLCPAHPPQA